MNIASSEIPKIQFVDILVFFFKSQASVVIIFYTLIYIFFVSASVVRTLSDILKAEAPGEGVRAAPLGGDEHVVRGLVPVVVAEGRVVTSPALWNR